MGKTVDIITIVPETIAKQLEQKQRVTGYFALQQIHPEIVKTIRGFMTDNVGYEDLPIAGLSSMKKGITKTKLAEYLPIASKKSVLFKLCIDEDSVISVSYPALLEASSDAEEAGDPSLVEAIVDSFRDQLYVGVSNDEEQISFIPFLDYKKCKYYARINQDLETSSDFTLPGIQQVTLRELTSFLEV